MKKFVYLLLALLPCLAQAQAIFEPVQGSKAMVLLASLFGGLDTFGAQGSADPFQGIVSVFNSAILVIGGMLVMYSVFAGTIGTAHDGEMLGKKFSSVWLPIRTALGTSLVLPVLNGYCVMQKIVAILIVNSIGLGDQAWVNYTTHLENNIQIGVTRPEAKRLGYTLLQNYVCLNALQQAVKSPDAQILDGGSDFGITEKRLADRTVLEFGDKNAVGGFSTDVCGSVEILSSQEVVTFPVQTGFWRATTAGKDSTERMQRIVEAHQASLNAMMGQMQSQAQQLVSTRSKLNPSVIDNIIAQYETSVRDKASSEVMNINVFSEVQQNASQDGWVGAGTFYNKILFIGDLVQRNMAKVPVAKGPSNTFVNRTFYDQYELALMPLLQTLNETAKGRQYGISQEVGGSNNPAHCDGLIDCWSKKVDINAYMKSIFTAGRENLALHQGENMVMATKRMGNTFLSMAGAAFTASMVAMPLAGVTPGIALAIFSGLLTFVAPMAVVGFTLSYVIPFLPVILCISAILSWVVMCVEAILISSLWAVMHLSPHGDDMVGTGTQGYRLVLNLMLTPILLVFGIITSIVLLQVFGDFIGAIFQDTFLSLNEDSNLFIVILSPIFSSLVYGSLSFVIIKRIFNFIHEFREVCLKWAGGGDNNLSHSAGQIANGGAMIAGAYVATKGGEITAGMGGVLKGLNKDKGKDTPESSKFEQLDNKISAGAKAEKQASEGKPEGEKSSYSEVSKDTNKQDNQ